MVNDSLQTQQLKSIEAFFLAQGKISNSTQGNCFQRARISNAGVLGHRLITTRSANLGIAESQLQKICRQCHTMSFDYNPEVLPVYGCAEGQY